MSNAKHTPRKRFGQNFLHDHNVIANILANLQAKPGDHWVEIGPGLGALTTPLLDENVTLDVVELDRDLVSHLRVKYKDKSNLTVHSADALKFDFSSLLNKPRCIMVPAQVEQDNNTPFNPQTVRPEPAEGHGPISREAKEKLRVVGNLPYNISTPLLFHLLETCHCIKDMHFMLQKEVVDRICAVPGSKKYGRLSVMMQYHCKAECVFDVYPESFDPAPQVMSSIIRLIPHEIPPAIVKDKALFNKVVTQAFSQRRKTLRNSLKTLVSEEAIVNLGIDPNARAETISLPKFAELSNGLVKIDD